MSLGLAYAADVTGQLTADVTVERGTVRASLDAGRRTHVITYHLPDGPVATAPDMLVPLALAPAMRIGAPLRVRAPVSPRLRASVPLIQDVFRLFFRCLRRIDVEVENRAAAIPSTERGVGAFFSGGVDSFYTAIKHREEITGLIFVHGFDIKLEDGPLRAAVSSELRQAAAELGKPLIEVETNMRAFSDPLVPWGLFFGSALASVALLLAPRFRRMYVPGDYSLADLHPYGSHPLLDPLWSTEDLEIVHDGIEATRVEKVEAIAEHETALRRLRSCWQHLTPEYNCGRCEKCIRTMVNLHLAGALERATTFPGSISPRRVARIAPQARQTPYFWRQNLAAAEQRGADPALTRAIRRCVRYGERRHPMRGLMNRLRPYVARAIGTVHRLGQRKRADR